jgi:hypothetical protein
MGPAPTNCSQSIFASLLREQEKRTAFRKGPDVKLGFPIQEDLVARVESLLLLAGCSDVELFRARLKLPQGRWLIRALPDNPPNLVAPPPIVDVPAQANQQILWNAVVLGLCNQTFYDSARPVIWTQNRLQRRLQLFAPGRNYYDD